MEVTSPGTQRENVMKFESILSSPGRRGELRRTIPRSGLWTVLAAMLCTSMPAWGQSVCLPAPRLLTTVPMGGKAGTDVEVTISGDFLDDVELLSFSDSRLTAKPKLGANGQPEANKFIVTIPADCPPGLYEARVMARLGMSSSRVFTVGTLPETTVTAPNTTLATAKELSLNSVCNASMTNRAVDHFVFEAKKGQRVAVECATRGIDSKLDAVVILADAAGRDLLVERGGGLLDYTIPEDGK